MAIYVSNQIIKGNINYKQFFSINIYKQYQADVDAILIAEGRQDLIVPIP